MEKMYSHHPPFPSSLLPNLQRRREFSPNVPATTSMSSNFFGSPYDSTTDFGSWPPPVNASVNNMMNLSSGPSFSRHPASPPPLPPPPPPPPPPGAAAQLMGPSFAHQGFAHPLPPPQPQFHGPIGGFQQQQPQQQQPHQFPLSPLHSPGLGPVLPHLHSNNGNSFAPPPQQQLPPPPPPSQQVQALPPPPGYHNIPPPPGPLGSRSLNHQLPPLPTFAMSFPNNSMNGVFHNGPRENGLPSAHHIGSYITPPVSAPSSPSPPPPHMIHGSLPTQLPNISPRSFQSSVPRTVVSRTSNKPPTPPLPKSNLSTSTVISRNESSNISTSNDQPAKPKLNPNASSFLPVVKSPAIVSSTPTPPPPKPASDPLPKSRFNPQSANFTPPSSSTPSREDQERAGKFDPTVPAFVPSETQAGGGRARSSPPLNAPTGPASLVSRSLAGLPTGPSSAFRYTRLPLSPPTGPKADQTSRIPPPPDIMGLGIGGMSATNELKSRDLPETTPLGPKAMYIPTGPRADRERPVSRTRSSREPYNSYHLRTSSDKSDDYLGRKKYAKEPLVPTVALTRVPGIEKPVPTGPAAMLADLPPAAKIPDVPIAPAAMLAKMENSSNNGSEDGGPRGRQPLYMRTFTGGLGRTRSHIIHRRSIIGGDSRNSSHTREEGSATPVSIVTEIEVIFGEDILPVAEELDITAEAASVGEETNDVDVKKLVDGELASGVFEAEAIPQDEELSGTLDDYETKLGSESIVTPNELPQDEEEIVSGEVELLTSRLEERADYSEVGGTDITEEATIPILEKQAVDETTADIAKQVITGPETETEAEAEAVGLKLSPPSTELTTVAVPPISLPIIQIEAVDSPHVALAPDPDETMIQRLSELSIRKREEEGDTIVSMKIEDGVVIVPTRDTPSPTAQLWVMAKKKGNTKDATAIENTEEAGETVIPTESTMEEENTVVEATISESVETQPPARPDSSSILSARKSKKNRRRNKKATSTTESETASAPPSTPLPAVALATEDTKAKKSSKRTTVIVGGVLKDPSTGVDRVLDITAKAASPVGLKDSETGVGFTAESPVPPVMDSEEPVPIALDVAEIKESSDEDTGVVKATLEEHDNEKDHDGGVKLDIGDAEEVLPPRPAVDEIELEPSKITEIYSDSESLRGEQEMEEDVVSAPVAEDEVKPLDIVKLGVISAVVDGGSSLTFAEQPVENDAHTLEEGLPVEVIGKPVAEIAEPVATHIEEPIIDSVVEPVEMPVVEPVAEPVPEPVAEVAVEPAVEPVMAPTAETLTEPVAEPIAEVTVEPVVEPVLEMSPVTLLLQELIDPAGPSTPESDDERIASKVLEPRYAEPVSISINSIVEALAACNDVSSLTGTLESYSCVAKPGTQEERLFKQLHQYAAISDPLKNDNSDKFSTRSKSSIRSVRSFFKRRVDAYPQLLASTTSRIKAILPPFLTLTAAPTVSTVPTASSCENPLVSATTATKSSRPRFIPRMTMNLLQRSPSLAKTQKVVAQVTSFATT